MTIVVFPRAKLPIFQNRFLSECVINVPMLSLVNEERCRYGMSKLSFDSSPNIAAQAHSDDMKGNVFFNHT